MVLALSPAWRASTHKKCKTKSKQPAEAEGETQLAQTDETPPNN
jgi:hypothetical protein